MANLIFLTQPDFLALNDDALALVDALPPIDYTPTDRGPTNEKPIHRIICYHAAAGVPIKEIATLVNYSREQVSAILRTERSAKMVSQIIEHCFKNDVSALLSGAQVSAVLEIQDLMLNAKSETVRLNSAKDILDRVRGKAVTSVEISKKSDSPSELLDEIETTKE